MVLESLVSTKGMTKKKRWIFVLGIVYVFVASFLSTLIFSSRTSLVMVVLTSLAAVPLMYKTIREEELRDVEEDVPETTLLKEHFHVLEGYMALFLGVTLGFVLLYVLLPSGALQSYFELQVETLKGINSEITGYSFEGFESFANIFLNNLQVLSLAVVFSFIFGAGAIFILVWNASVIGAAIGNFITNNLELIEDSIGWENLCSQFFVVNFGLFRYAIHGVPEILAYFVGALAGGIIAFAVIRHDFMSKKFESIVLDSADLLLIGIGLLFVSAVLEVWVTPLLFNVEMFDMMLSSCSV